MGNNSVPKFIFCLSRFPVYRGSILGRFYCIKKDRNLVVMTGCFKVVSMYVYTHT